MGRTTTTLASLETGSLEHETFMSRWRWSGMPFPAPADVTVALFGPYDTPAQRDEDRCLQWDLQGGPPARAGERIVPLTGGAGPAAWLLRVAGLDAVRRPVARLSLALPGTGNDDSRPVRSRTEARVIHTSDDVGAGRRGTSTMDQEQYADHLHRRPQVEDSISTSRSAAAWARWLPVLLKATAARGYPTRPPGGAADCCRRFAGWGCAGRCPSIRSAPWP